MELEPPVCFVSSWKHLQCGMSWSSLSSSSVAQAGQQFPHLQLPSVFSAGHLVSRMRPRQYLLLIRLRDRT